MITQAVILAGGKGTRLGELTRGTPKPVLPVAGKPFLEYLIWNLKRYGIRNIIITLNHLADKVRDSLGDGSRLGVKIEYFSEPKPLDTGGAFVYLKKKLDDIFLVLNGDTILDVNYLALFQMLESNHADACMALRKVEDRSRYGSVLLEGDKIVGFEEKIDQSGSGWINGGIYLLRKSTLKTLTKSPCSLEKDFFPALVKDPGRNVLALPTDNFFIDIGIPEEYCESQYSVPEWMNRPAVFFNLDGVVNVNYGYEHKQKDFYWVDGADDTIRWCNENSYLAILIANQSGTKRDYYTETQFHNLYDWIQGELALRGAHFDAVYHCPHCPTEAKGKYLQACNCRKPNPGMLLNALSDWPIIRDKSIFVGDSEDDLKAARVANIYFMKYSSGNIKTSLLEFVKNKKQFLSDEKKEFGKEVGLVNYELALNIIDECDVVLFNLYDSLIVRPYVDKADIFRLMERRLKIKNFATNRIKAEKTARNKLIKRNQEEVTLDEIYLFIDEEFRYVKQYELDEEINCCLRNEQFSKFYDYAIKQHKQVVIISENSLPRETVQKILMAHGYAVYDRLYLSNEVLKQKAGGLLDHILEDMSVTQPERLVHFGSNMAMDILPSLEHGMRIFYYPTLLDQLLNLTFIDKKTIRKIKEKEYLDLSFLIGICSIAISTSQLPCDNSIKAGQSIVWPIVMLFNNWLKIELIKNGIEFIYFIAGNGSIFKHTFDLLNNNGKTFKTKKLSLSERSSVVPVESFYSANYDQIVQNIKCDCDKEGMWKDLKINSEAFKSEFDKYINKFTNQNTSLKKLFNSFLKENRSSFLNCMNTEKYNFTKYLLQEQVFDGKSALVGIEGCGSIQRSIKLISGELGKFPKIHGYYIATSEIDSLQQNECRCLCVENSLPESAMQTITAAQDAVNYFLKSPERNISYFEEKSGTIVPACEHEDQFKLDISKRVSIGVISNSHFFSRVKQCNNHIFDAKDYDSSVLVLFDLLSRIPLNYLYSTDNFSC